MEVSFSDPMLSQILPGSSLPTGFFSSGLRFALKYSLSRIKGAFLYICQLSLFSFPPRLSPSLSHNYWQIADFPSVGLTDNWLNSSLKVSVRHRGRRGAEGVGFCAYWKNFFSSKQKVHVHCRLHIPCLSTRDLYVCMCGEWVSACVWGTQRIHLLSKLQIHKLFLKALYFPADFFCKTAADRLIPHVRAFCP